MHRGNRLIKVYKQPGVENDEYLVEFNQFSIENYEDYISADDYTRLKAEQFANFDASKIPWQSTEFAKDRPALRNLDTVPDMSGSIYTITCSLRNIDYIHEYNHINFYAHYLNCIELIKNTLNNKPNSRRVFMRMANSLMEYAKSESGKYAIDTTCLAGIHYLENSFKLIFRASDIKNELIPDILTIYKFFIVPVYGTRKLKMSIYASTAQNIKEFNNAIESIGKLV